MSKADTKGKRRSTKRVEDEQAPRASFLELVGHDTVRGVTGVILFVVGLIVALSGVGMAGVAGDQLYQALAYVVGVGYVLVPLLLLGVAVSLMRRAQFDRAVGPIRAAGGLLFFVAGLGIVHVLLHGRAGVLGGLVGDTLVRYLDTLATLVLLAGFVVVSLLLLFDSGLWLQLFDRLRALVPHKEAVDPNEPVEVEPTVHEWPTETPRPVQPEEEDDDEPQTLDEDEDDVLPIVEKPKKEAPRHAPLPSVFVPPPLSILESDRGKPNTGDTKVRANLIRRTLQHFKIPVEMDEIVVGPTVTRYSLKPAEGVRLNKIVALQSNLELALAASPIRIEAPIPGKSLVGIEVPNTVKATVGLSALLSAAEFAEETVPLLVTLGKDISGTAHYANIGKMPHCLVAGTTGSGKSVMMHSMIASLLYRNGPDRMRFIMVDPKRVELTLYDNIPHLLTPVITEARACIQALKWATKEMDRRYNILRTHKVQELSAYHAEVVAPAIEELEALKKKGGSIEDFEMPEQLPYIVVVIDELADIMTAYPRELEAVIVRLAQMSRAVGIHLILSTQRPSVNVITGLIKANIPTRIALKVASLIDSRTILDQPGAEKLLGAGDMLYLSGDMPKPRRIQSPFIGTTEVKKIVHHLIKYNDPELDMLSLGGENGDGSSEGGGITINDFDEDDSDNLYEDARKTVIEAGKASTSYLQRKLGIGYGRAAKLVDLLEARGVVGPANGSKPREILVGGSAGADEDEDTYTEEDPNER